MKKFYSKVVAALAFAAVCTTTAEATPAFARQMNTDCMSCHYQNIPKLNKFGREFKLSGFTMTGGGQEIKSKASGGLDLPSTLNMSFVIKARYHDVADKNGVRGSHQALTELYDESAFIFGGKVSENVGVSMEFIAGLAGGKIIYSKALDYGRFGGAFAMTDALGVFAGLEPYSTGLYRPVRQFENRSRANIFQRLGIGAGAAQGAQLYYSGHGFFATVGQYTPVYGASTDTSDGYKVFARAGYETNLAGMDVAVGGYYIGGDVTDNNTTATGKEAAWDANAYNRESFGLDLQVEGDVAKMPLMVTAGWVLKNEYTNAGVINTAKNRDITGFSVGAQLNPVDKWGVKLAYLSYKDDSINVVTPGLNDQESYTIGTDYNLAQNIRLTLEYSVTEYDNSALSNQTDFLFMTQLAF
jgi:hypothetical protein